jgi:3-hydroxyisobutyrate dehydrogenase
VSTKKEKRMRVAWIGLGAMGRPMAANLAARFETLVHNRTAEVADEHARQHGSRAVRTYSDLAAAGPDVVASCLPTTAEVAACASELAPLLASGTVWIDHTSGEPEATRALAEQLSTHGISLLDAPVSGGTDGAEAGTLTTMVGGEADVLERVGGVLDAIAGRVVHVGPVGAGMAVKAVNNALLAASLWASAEGLVALRGAGVPTATALQVINASSGRSFATERLLPERVVPRTFPKTFALRLLAKDVGIAGSVLDDGGVDGQVLSEVIRFTAAAAEELGRDADHVELVRIVERAAGLEL